MHNLKVSPQERLTNQKGKSSKFPRESSADEGSVLKVMKIIVANGRATGRGPQRGPRHFRGFPNASTQI